MLIHSFKQKPLEKQSAHVVNSYSSNIIINICKAVQATFFVPMNRASTAHIRNTHGHLEDCEKQLVEFAKKCS